MVDAAFGAYELASWRARGFVTWQRFLGHACLRDLRAKCDAVVAARHPSLESEWVQNIHQLLGPLGSPGNWMWRLASAPAIVHAVRTVLGSGDGGGTPLLYASQIAYRMPARHDLECTPWHQDGPGTKVCTFWIALDRVDRANGALEVLPGGHREGRRPLVRVAGDGDQQELQLALSMAQHNVFQCNTTDDEDANASLSYRLRAGGAGLHHPSLPHRAGPNRTARPRRVIVLRYMCSSELTARDGGKLRDWRDGSWFARAYLPVVSQ